MQLLELNQVVRIDKYVEVFFEPCRSESLTGLVSLLDTSSSEFLTGQRFRTAHLLEEKEPRYQENYLTRQS